MKCEICGRTEFQPLRDRPHLVECQGCGHANNATCTECHTPLYEGERAMCADCSDWVAIRQMDGERDRLLRRMRERQAREGWV